MSQWRAIQCQTQREAMARDKLEAIGVPCWFPYRLSRRWRPDRKTFWAKVPYFPGYVFADLEPIDHLPSRIEGVERILGETAIPSRTMIDLMALAEDDGRIREPLLKPGEHLHVGTAGLIVEFLHVDRASIACVLVPLFGQMCRATVPASHLLVGL